MTDLVNPSINRAAEAYKTAGAIALAGGSGEGWISPAAEPSDISVQESGIDDTVLNAFAETSSGTSFDVTIDPGEAFVYGSWVAVDTATTVTLGASTTGQTVYVGWNKDGTNDVIIGLDSAFSSAAGTTDEKIPLYDFDTDGSGVTSVTDRRELGQYHSLSHAEIADELGIPVYADTTNAPQEEGNLIRIDGSGTDTAGIYSHDGSSYVEASKTEEAIEDIVSGLLLGGTNITLTYDDANNELTIDTSALDAQEVDDRVNSLLSPGDKLSTTYDDANDTLSIDTTALDAEEVQDAVNNLIADGNAISTTYDDANDTLTIDVDIGDDQELTFGASDDMSVRYDSTNDEIRWEDNTNTTDRMALDRTTGNLNITGEITENTSI